MGFLDRFTKRKRRQPDRVWTSASARLRGLWQEARSLSEAGAVLVLAHFPARRDELHRAPEAPSHEELSSAAQVAGFLTSRTPGSVAVALARDLGAAPPPGHRHERPAFVLIAERHPLRARDETIGEALATYSGPDVLRFHLALDDPLLTRFLGDAVAPLLEQLGLSEDEAIDSPMIDRAIARAQGRVASKARADLETASSEAWLKTNLPR